MVSRKNWLTVYAGLALTTAICAPYAVQSKTEAKPATKPAAKVSVLKNVTVTVTPGTIAKTVTVKTIPAVANDPSGPPFMNGEPEHFRVTFDNEKIADYSGLGDRQLLVYPVAEYGKLFKGKEKSQFDKTILNLQTVISKKDDGGLKELPALPAIEAYQVFHSHVKHLLFKQGKGIAYITCYAQDDATINNGDFFYTYQGITDDQKYYVSLCIPVKAKGFPKDCPSKKAKTILNGLPSSSFTPDLDQIDALVQSISVK